MCLSTCPYREKDLWNNWECVENSGNLPPDMWRTLYSLVAPREQQSLMCVTKSIFVLGRDIGLRKRVYSKGKLWLDVRIKKDELKVNGDKSGKVRQGSSKQQGLVGLLNQIRDNADQYIHSYNTCLVESSHAERLTMTDKRLDEWQRWGPAARYAYSRINDGPVQHLSNLFQQLSLHLTDISPQQLEKKQTCNKALAE